MAQFRTDTKKLDGKNLVTRYEVMMLSDKLTPGGTITDAFGRLRVSNPITLFDSQHRYQLNNKFANTVSGSGSIEYKQHESAVNLKVGTSIGDKVYRESTRVFSYQPGKSLLVLNTAVFNEDKTGLRQRIGYFNANNGIYLEKFGSNNYIVLRSYSSGTLSERRVLQTDWNVDTFTGNGYSSQSSAGSEWTTTGLNLSKSNIFWMDIEWLGVGDVRTGFVVDGRMVTAHVFHNENVNATTYMTTATLPIRCEIENVNATSSNSTFKQICSSVISEGGYQLIGRPRSVGRSLTDEKTLTSAGTFYPVVSIRLKDSRMDAVAILKNIEFFATSNNTKYRYQLRVNPVLTSPSWTSANTNSCIEYDFSATGVSDGDIAQQGYLSVSGSAGAQTVELLGTDLFSYQLERDPFKPSDKGIILSLVATGSAGDKAIGAMAWEEIT